MWAADVLDPVGFTSELDYAILEANLRKAEVLMEGAACDISHAHTPGHERLVLDPAYFLQMEEAIASGNIDKIKTLEPKLVPDTKAPKDLRGNSVNTEEAVMALRKAYMEHLTMLKLLSSDYENLEMAFSLSN